jgi:hypothetical protein
MLGALGGHPELIIPAIEFVKWHRICGAIFYCRETFVAANENSPPNRRAVRAIFQNAFQMPFGS